MNDPADSPPTQPNQPNQPNQTKKPLNKNYSIEIRVATSADVPLILGFIKSLAEYEKLAHEVVATAETLRQSLFGPKPFAEILIGSIDGVAGGFALFFHNYSTFLAKPGIYLEDLYVDPQYRGSGLGKALLRQLAVLATERGCGRVEWSVLNWNQPAIDFYNAIGARPLSEWMVYRLTGPALAAFAATPATPARPGLT